MHRLSFILCISPNPSGASSRPRTGSAAPLLLSLVVPCQRHLDTLSATRQGEGKRARGMADSSRLKKSILPSNAGWCLVAKAGGCRWRRMADEVSGDGSRSEVWWICRWMLRCACAVQELQTEAVQKKSCRGFTDTGEKREKRGGNSATLQLLQGNAGATKLALTFTL